MTKPFPAFCKDCKHSKPEKNSTWNLLCHHPVINAKNSYALSRAGTFELGSDCRDQRSQKSWFAPCGMRGKLWEKTT